MISAAWAGKIISKVGLNQETDTVNGSWAMIYEQISLVSLDGTVHPIYTGQTASPITSNLQSGGETGIGSHIDVNRGKAASPTQTTTYYLADHLGSSRLIASGNGYPIWSGVFLPYGQEWNPQITMNHYKFTGDERDAESNIDHTWFRQYEGTQGRWLTPDPAGISAVDPTDPQTLNTYAYVVNAPTILFDPDGLIAPGPCLLAGTCSQLPAADPQCQVQVDGLCEDILVGPDFNIPDVRPKLRRHPSINGNQNCTFSQRAQMFGNGILNLGIAGAKISAAAGVEAGTSGLGTALAVWGVYSASGNVATGVIQTVGAFMPNAGQWQQAASISATAGTLSGLTTLAITGGNVTAATHASRWEGIFMFGFKGGATGNLPNPFSIVGTGVAAGKEVNSTGAKSGC